MAALKQPARPARYDVLAEGLTADGRVVKKVEASADGLADVAEAFRLAAAEARKAHLPVARVRMTAGRGGAVEVAATDGDGDPLLQSALLDGKTKMDAPPRPAVITHGRLPCPHCGHEWTPGKSATDCHFPHCKRAPQQPGIIARVTHSIERLLAILHQMRPAWRLATEYQVGQMRFVVSRTDVRPSRHCTVSDYALEYARDLVSIASFMLERLDDP